jgi:hypothetical protein
MFLSAITLLAVFDLSAVVLVLLAGMVALLIGECKRRFVK